MGLASTYSQTSQKSAKEGNGLVAMCYRERLQGIEQNLHSLTDAFKSTSRLLLRDVVAGVARSETRLGETTPRLINPPTGSERRRWR